MFVSTLPDPERHPLWPGIHRLLAQAAARLGSTHVWEPEDLLWIVIDETAIVAVLSSRLLEDDGIGVFRDVFDTYELHYHLAIESARSPRFRTIETPVSRSYPKKGKTPTKISPVRGNLHVMGVLLKAVRGRYRLTAEPERAGASR